MSQVSKSMVGKGCVCVYMCVRAHTQTCISSHKRFGVADPPYVPSLGLVLSGSLSLAASGSLWGFRIVTSLQSVWLCRSFEAKGPEWEEMDRICIISYGDI